MSEKFWMMDYKKVILVYLIVSISSVIIEFLLTNEIFWSFWITYIGLFISAHFIVEGLNTLFTEFHVTPKVRNLATRWILFLILTPFYFLFFFTGIIPAGEFNPELLLIFFMLAIIILTILSINPFIRIVAINFHRRKIDLFPINRIEFAAMEYLKEGDSNFTKLVNRLKGVFNIFIPQVYFDEETAASSIYRLCGLRFADIDNDKVSLNEDGKKQVNVWEDTLNNQTKTFNNILNSRSVLIKSFIGLFIISILKIFIGYISSSNSIFAEGFENFLDCIAVILIGLGIKYDKEKLANIILVCLMSFTGITILIGAIESLFSPGPIENFLIIIIISLVSIFLNTYLQTLKNFVGKKNRNSSLVASSIDSKVNIYLSVGIIVTALLSYLGSVLNPPIIVFGIWLSIPSFLYYADPLIAIVIIIFIFREVVEIIREFITGEEEDIEFESFQMEYEDTFKEYIAKWIISVLYNEKKKDFSSEQLNTYFQESLKKGEDIYTEFSSFGLYLFKEKGINRIIKQLLDISLLSKMGDGILRITEKGTYAYENFYSGELFEDIVDPFDFFFISSEDTMSFDKKKKEMLEEFEKNFQKS